MSVRWRKNKFHYNDVIMTHNDHDSVSNRQPHGCLLNRLFRRRSKITSKLRVTGLCVGNSPGPVNSPHKGPVARKMFPFDDVIMIDGSTSTCIPVIWIGNAYVAVAEKNWNICIYSQIYTGIYNINLIGTFKQCVVYRLRQKYSLWNSR